jgi:hypothetical protein
MIKSVSHYADFNRAFFTTLEGLDSGTLHAN